MKPSAEELAKQYAAMSELELTIAWSGRSLAARRRVVASAFAAGAGTVGGESAG
ncbi:MAG: hypothetical protein KGN79_05360 [Acidobacteriota bacterium]|nr:hypothetical protein [Acidobacteriota bacterium]